MAKVPQSTQTKTKKTGKRPDKRPCRTRYWISGRLALKKIRNLVRSGYEPRAALKVWQATRRRYYGALPSVKKIDKLGKAK